MGVGKATVGVVCCHRCCCCCSSVEVLHTFKWTLLVCVLVYLFVCARGEERYTSFTAASEAWAKLQFVDMCLCRWVSVSVFGSQRESELIVKHMKTVTTHFLSPTSYWASEGHAHSTVHGMTTHT